MTKTTSPPRGSEGRAERFYNSENVVGYSTHTLPESQENLPTTNAEGGRVAVFSTDDGRPLTKTHEADENGNYRKVSGGEMTSGRVRIVDVDKPSAFAAMRATLNPSEGITLGLPIAREANVVTAGQLAKAPPGSIARTNDCLSFPAGPGWFFVDVDPLPGAEALTREEALDVLLNVAPDLSEAGMLWFPSSSSYVYDTSTDQWVTELRGQRLYILVADARDIPRAGKALYDRLWLAGHGCFISSKSGRLLNRNIIDSSVWSPSHFDFAAPPVCRYPYEQRPPEPIIVNDNAAPVDTMAAIPPLSDQEKKRLAEMQKAAKEAPDLLAQRDLKKGEWVAKRVEAMNLPVDKIEDARRRLYETLETGRLFSDFILKASDGRLVSVGELLDAPDRWHNRTFFDPLEWDYGNHDRRIARVNLRSGGQPYIYSFAHGGTRYELLRQTLTIRVEGGNMPGVQENILEVLRMEHEVFERVGRLASLHRGEIRPLGQNEVINMLERRFNFEIFDGRSGRWQRKDCPQGLALRLVSNFSLWGLPIVTGVTPFPVVRPDGSIVDQPGFDAQTGIIYLSDTNEVIRPRVLSRKELTFALKRIWEPFAQFPFVSGVDRGVFLSALLTTMCRPALPVCVAYLIRASAAGTGKTRLSECLMIILGAPERAMTLVEDRAEVEKRVFANLLAGQTGVVFDNLTRDIDDSSLCSYLTSPNPSGRILGKTEMANASNRALWVFNGNNVSAIGDSFRRILPVTLNAGCESPETRRFSFDPRELIRDRLNSYRQDLLSVLLSFKTHGRRVGEGTLGSFEVWEGLVRQCICWLIEERLIPDNMGEVEDPLLAIEINKAEDPVRGSIYTLLDSWYGLFGNAEVHLKDIEELCNQPFAGPKEEEFVAAVQEVAGWRGKNVESRWLGKFIKAHAGKVVEGYRIDRPAGICKDPGWVVSCLTWDTPPG